MTNGDEVEDSMQRLGQKARSAGILIHIATQTPRADIIKGKIKANLPSQIVYKVANSIESDIAIGESGAERLLGKGDTYVKWSDNPSLVRVQGVFLTDENINDIIDSTIKKYPDERYYNERVPMDAFEDGYIKPKDLGADNIKKGGVYRYAIKHQKSPVIDEDMDEQDVVIPSQEKPKGTPAIASAQPYETTSVHKESFEEYRKRYEEKNAMTALELDDILGTRKRKVEALIKQMELDKKKEQEQEKETPQLDHEVEEAIEERISHTEPEPTTPVDKEAIANELYPDEPTPTEEVKKDNSILPKPIPKDWKFRKTGNRGKM